MKIRTIVAVACLAVFGLAQGADAKPHRAKHHAVKKTKNGVSTSTTDVNGDGVPDVVVKPKPKPKSAPTSTGGVTVGQ